MLGLYKRVFISRSHKTVYGILFALEPTTITLLVCGTIFKESTHFNCKMYNSIRNHNLVAS